MVSLHYLLHAICALKNSFPFAIGFVCLEHDIFYLQNKEYILNHKTFEQTGI